MSDPRRLTLARLFLLAVTAVALVVGAAFVAFVRSSRASILLKADALRAQAASRIESKLAGELERAKQALDDVEAGVRSGAINPADDRSLEVALFLRAVDDPHLEEITLTQARTLGFDAAGEAVLAPEGRRQISVFRMTDGRLFTRITEPGANGFVVRVRHRARDGGFMTASLEPAGSAADPTTHPTFTVLASRRERGRVAWSDLHYSEADQALPVNDRRSVVSVQKAILDARETFLGVLRVGLLTGELDALAEERIDDDPRDPQRIAIMAMASGAPGRAHLVARVNPDDRMAVVDGDLRVVPAHPPPEIAALDASPLLTALDSAHPSANAAITVGGAPWLATLRELSIAQGGTSGWFVALLVPESHYTRDFERDARNLLLAYGSTLILVLLIGGLTLVAVQRSLGRIQSTTARMRAFDFAPADNRSPFRDVDDVMKDLERAKTVVRAMGKYIPMDLVRSLYASNHEPELGGVPTELSLMFTDLAGFTALSERLPPDDLARRLGEYLEAMTVAIDASGGTIDKYIGDAVMAFWNAPTPIEAHAERACRAALACMDAARALYASPAWAGLPPMVTRFGIHTARVLVGHFGAPKRLNYTALGDGVNLAARLEPLCKQYGVVSLVSENTVAACGKAFAFRRIDRVAVVGKTRGIDVYELLGATADDLPGLALARRYEEAFDAYLARHFLRAAEIVQSQVDRDPPSAVLAARCREFEIHPPPDDWDGVHAARTK